MQRETANKQRMRATLGFGEEGAVNVTSSQPFADCPLLLCRLSFSLAWLDLTIFGLCANQSQSLLRSDSN